MKYSKQQLSSKTKQDLISIIESLQAEPAPEQQPKLEKGHSRSLKDCIHQPQTGSSKKPTEFEEKHKVKVRTSGESAKWDETRRHVKGLKKQEFYKDS